MNDAVTPAPIRLYIDADACPVKDEVYKVGARYGLKTFVVSNSFMMIPPSPLIERVVVDAGPDIADDWIAERAAPGDVVVTNDIPLADRVLKAGAAAIKPTGHPFTNDGVRGTIHFQHVRYAEVPESEKAQLSIPSAIDEIVARAEVKHHHYLNFRGGEHEAASRGIGLRFIEFIDPGAPVEADRIH